MNRSPAATQTPEALIAAVDAGRRDDVARLDALIRRTAPQLEPVVYGKMLGYGPFHYCYASGREGDTCRLALAANKHYLSLYVLAADARGYVAERYRDRLPRADIGKSCVRFKRLEHLDSGALVALLQEAASTGYPGAEPAAAASAGEAKAAKKKASVAGKARSARKAPAAKRASPARGPKAAARR